MRVWTLTDKTASYQFASAGQAAAAAARVEKPYRHTITGPHEVKIDAPYAVTFRGEIQRVTAIVCDDGIQYDYPEQITSVDFGATKADSTSRHTVEDLAYLRKRGFVETADEIERLHKVEDAARAQLANLAGQVLGSDSKVFFRSWGRDYRITAIFADDAGANAFMEASPGQGVIANIGPFVFLADVKDAGEKVDKAERLEGGSRTHPSRSFRRSMTMAVNTPLATIETLRSAPARKGNGGGDVVEVDTRILNWLCDDAERLNKLESSAIKLGYEIAEDALALVPPAQEG